MANAIHGERLQLPIDLAALARRTRAYVARCECWVEQRRDAREVLDDGQFVAIVKRLSPIVGAEILTALDGWLHVGDDRSELAVDPDAAATLALTAIEHSRQAWLALVRTRQVGAAAAAPFVTDLVWLKHEVERAFPSAAG